MRKFLFLSILVALSFSANIFAQNADDIVGLWFVEEKDAKVEVYNCGKGYCAKIVWLEEPNENGKPKVDDENPDASLRDRPILNLEFLKNFKFDGEKYYEGGSIYNSRDGKTYDGYLFIQDDGTLLLKGGYKVLGMTIGKSSVWSRAE